MNDFAPMAAEDGAPWLQGGIGRRLAADGAGDLGRPAAWSDALKNAVGLILQSGFPMFVVWGPDHTLIYNDAYAPILADKHPAALGCPFWSVWPEVRPQIEPVIAAAFAGERSFFEDLEVAVVRRGVSRPGWFTFSYSPVYDAAGATPGVLCVCVETTSGVLAREQLAEAHRHQTRMFEQAPGFICTLEGPEHRFTFTNNTHKRLFGRDMTGLPVREAFPELEGQGFFEMLDEVYATGERVAGRAAPASVQHAPGEPAEELFLDFVYEPMFDAEGGVYGIFCEGFDVTEAHLARLGQQESEARQRFLDRLAAETSPLAEANEILATTTRLVGEHLALSICAYADMDEDAVGFTIRGDWSAPGSASIVGHYRLHDFGRKAVENLSAGLPLVINNNLEELPPDEAATFQAIGITATICMPLVKEGRLAALMAIHQSEPRVWTDAELGLIREVTERSWAHIERVGAEAELRASEEELRLITDAVPVLISYIDAEHRYQFVNLAYEAWFGRSRSDLQGRKVVDVMGAEAYAQVRHYLDQALAGGRVSFESHMVYRDVGPRDIQAHFVPRVDGHGAVIGVFALVSDITERVAAEAALRESRAELERRLNAIPQMVWSTPPDGRHDFFNDRWFEFTGLSPEASGSDAWLRATHPDDRARISEHWTASLTSGEPLEAEHRVHHHSGGHRWVLARARPIRDAHGDVVRWMGTCTDIDELKRTSGELQRTSALLTLISDSTPDLIYAKDRQSRIIYVNAAGQRVMGRPTQELIGLNDFDFAQDKNQAAAIIANDQKVMRAGSVVDVDETFTSPDGETRTFRSLKAPLRTAAGEIVGLVGVTSDITDRHKALERERLLAREVDHRAKNLLAIVQSIVRLTRADNAEQFARAVEDRVHALSRVHGLLATNRWDGAQLEVLIREELAAFTATASERVILKGPDISLYPEAAQAIAMVLHELTTNAAKYGALSVDAGTLAVAWARDGDSIQLEWVERGGPPVRPPSRRGFGSTLLRGSIEKQLRGRLETLWEPEGLTVRLNVPAVQGSL
jgi:PAS domain S-box-containing protein